MSDSFTQGLDVDVNMLWFKVEARSGADRIQSARRHIDATLLQFAHQLCPVNVSSRIEINIISETQTSATHIRDPIGVVFANLGELVFEVLASADGVVH